MTVDRLSPLLDGVALEGTLAIRREFGPPVHTVIVARTAAAAADAVASRCQLWGGAGHLLVPAGAPSPTPTSPWSDLVLEADSNAQDVVGMAADALPRVTPLVFGRPEPIAVVLASLDRDRSSFSPLRIPELDPNDPWWIAYRGVIGWIPDAPEPSTLQMSELRPEISYADLLSVERAELEGSGDDLLERLLDRRAITPIHLTLMGLGISRPASGIFDTESTYLSARRRIRNQFGPNVVVVYEEGSLDDLCLIWCLRASMGWPHGLPLAVPRTADVGDVLKRWRAKAAWTWTNLGSPPSSALTSASVSHEELESLASELGNEWSPVGFGDLLGPPDRPARSSSDVATFRNGRAHVPAWSPADVQELGSNYSLYEGLAATMRARPAPRLLPPYRSLAVNRLSSVYRRGWVERSAGHPDSILEITWPTGWTVVEAYARDRGLRARRSSAGQAAEALVHRMGDLDDVELLANRKVLALLYRLCERVGMTWFRDRVNRLVSQVLESPEADRLRLVESSLNELVASRDDAKLHSTTPNQSGLSGSRDGIAAWFAWAERSGVLVRGADLHCDACGARTWRAALEWTPPIACPSCGRTLSQPFKHDVLQFRYRAAEPLLRVVEHDALGHLLTLSWMVQLFGRAPGRPAYLYGGHPGVEFLRGDNVLGEADVLLLFADGTSAIGEYKRSGAGLREGELGKLDRLADALDADWTFVATHDQAAACPDLWRECRRTSPDRPRFAICGERLFALPIAEHSTNPMDWPTGDTRERALEKPGPGDAAAWAERLANPDRSLHDAWAYDDSENE